MNMVDDLRRSPDGELHILLMNASELALTGDESRIMNNAERDRLSKLVHNEDRLRFTARCVALRTILSAYASTAPIDWVFETNEHGQPRISSPRTEASPLAFNISHSGDDIAIGIARTSRLGIDLECGRTPRDPLKIGDRFFAQSEARDLRACPAEQRDLRFLEYWTLKESYIKAHGKGLSMPLDEIVFDLSSAGRISFTEAAIDIQDRSPWKFLQYRLTDNTCMLSACIEVRGAHDTLPRIWSMRSIGSVQPLHPDIARQS